jgi:hypothetical protein
MSKNFYSFVDALRNGFSLILKGFIKKFRKTDILIFRVKKNSKMAQQNQGGMAQVHYFEPGPYKEVICCLTEFAGFVMGEAQKGQVLDQKKLGDMLNIYIQYCLKSGPEEGAAAPAGATCTHVYIKGKNENQPCNKPAKHVGVDGTPKCAAHKGSKPAKKEPSQAEGMVSGAHGQTFSYAANAGKGKTAPQSLTTIQQSIAEQTKPAQLSLKQTADGRFYHDGSGIQFEQRPEGWVAIGTVNGPATNRLTETDVYVCQANIWKWDETRVDRASSQTTAPPFIVQGDHPLIQSRDQVLEKKIESIRNNNNSNN